MSRIQLHGGPMSIAFVANTSWSIYNFRKGIIEALISAGHKVYTIAPYDDYSDKLTAIGSTYISLQLQAHSTSPVEDLMTINQLRRIYKKNKFDLVIHYTIKMNIYGALIARMSGIKSINVITGLGRTFQLSVYTQAVIKRLYKLSCYVCNDIWFLNSEDRSRFIEEGLISREQGFILPSEGVNTKRFFSTPLNNGNKKVIRFLFAGRLLKDKGILEYIAAAKELHLNGNSAKFEVVGFVNPNNPMSVSLADLEQWQNNGWINYLGSHEDIRPFINRADCIVFPSYYQEGISRILLEAASMSRPIITTDHVGCRDVVEHMHNGILITKKSTKDLLNALTLFLNLPLDHRMTMGMNGRKLVKEKYDERKVIELYFLRIFKNAKTAIGRSSQQKLLCST